MDSIVRATIVVQEARLAPPMIDLSTWDPEGRRSPQFAPIVIPTKHEPHTRLPDAQPACARERTQPTAALPGTAAAAAAAGTAEPPSSPLASRTLSGDAREAPAALAAQASADSAAMLAPLAAPAAAAVPPLRAVLRTEGAGARARAARALARPDGSVPLVLTRAQFGQVRLNPRRPLLSYGRP
jgi:hypothetical protein